MRQSVENNQREYQQIFGNFTTALKELYAEQCILQLFGPNF